VDQDIKHWLARVGDATERLRATVAGLTDPGAAEPSRLPGWTRGHVLTHIARNADGLANLLRWARTGTRIPMYASREARAADIEAGAGRPAAELVADMSASSAAFADEAARMPDDAWTATVQALTGGPIPAAEVLLLRLSEVEIHHVDLGAGYGYRDWPDEFVAAALARVAESFRGREDAPPCRLAVTGGRTYLLGPASDGLPQVSGSAHDALAWLLGRDTGGGLHVASGSLPVLPPWR
jgi:maleylpyruvate isomerase